MDGVMMFLLKEVDLERQDGEEFVDIATDVLDAILLPSPDLWSNIVIDGDVCMRFYIFRDIEVEAWIVNENDTVRMPVLDIALAHPHVPENCRKMEQHRNKAHVGEIAVMLHQGTTHRCHHIATKEAKIGLNVNFFQRPHQVRCMEVA